MAGVETLPVGLVSYTAVVEGEEVIRTLSTLQRLTVVNLADNMPVVCSLFLSYLLCFSAMDQ